MIRPMIDTARRQDIRSRIVAGKDAIARLRSQAPDVGFNEYMLTPALTAFEDVERVWLDDVIAGRSPAAEAAWLDHAEVVFNIGVRHLRAADAAFKKFGPSVRVIGR